MAGVKKVKVTFKNFLDFVVKSQGDGPDPYGEIKQVCLYIKRICFQSFVD